MGRAREYPICRFQQIIPVYSPSVQVKIIQFPMLAGYSCTVHGKQGCSYVWVDMAVFFAAAHAYAALSRARSLQGQFILNCRRDAFLVDPHYVQSWNWFVATNILSPKPLSQVPPYPRRTFTASLIIGIMCVHRAWRVVSQLPRRLDARILKVNMLHIIQYVLFPYWSYIERQLRADKLSLDIDDLNEDETEQIRKQGRPVGTSRQPSQGFELLACKNPRVFAAQDLAQMSIVQLPTLCATHKLSASGTKAQFQERILQKQKHIQPPSSAPSPPQSQARVQPVPSSINDFPPLQATSYLLWTRFLATRKKRYHGGQCALIAVCMVVLRNSAMLTRGLAARGQFLRQARHPRCDIGSSNATCSNVKGYLYSRRCPTRTTHLAALNCWRSLRVGHTSPLKTRRWSSTILKITRLHVAHGSGQLLVKWSGLLHGIIMELNQIPIHVVSVSSCSPCNGVIQIDSRGNSHGGSGPIVQAFSSFLPTIQATSVQQ